MLAVAVRIHLPDSGRESDGKHGEEWDIIWRLIIYV